MRIFIILLLSLFIITPASAQDATDMKVKAEIPYREDAGLSKAEYLLARGKYAAAIGETNSIINRHPKSADAYTYRGYAYMQLGDAENALKNFNRALAISPAHLGANKYRADMYLADGQLSLALEQLQVIRMTCGSDQCEEQDDLERSINAYRNGNKKPAAVGER